MNPAMILTGSRLFTGPLFAFLFLKAMANGIEDLNVPYLIAAVVAALLLELSDAFDGMVARGRNEVTALGKIFDPVCDAISRQTMFLAFVLTGIIPWWIFLVFLNRDSLVYLLRIMVAKEGTVMAASSAGKFKAITQAIATFVILLLVYLQAQDIIAPAPKMTWGFWVMLVPVFFTIQSGYQYFKNNWSVIVKMATPENRG